jgi:hypothetical protein
VLFRSLGVQRRNQRRNAYTAIRRTRHILSWHVLGHRSRLAALLLLLLLVRQPRRPLAFCYV